MSWLPSHRCFTPGPFTLEIAPIGGMLECSRFPSVVARLVLVAGHYCLPGPMSWSSVSGRPLPGRRLPPGRRCQNARPVNRMPTIGGSQLVGWVPTSARPRPPGAARGRAPTRLLLRGGVWIHVGSRPVADRAPIGCWGASTWRPRRSTAH